MILEKREVDKSPTCPELTNDQIKIITNICFRHDDQPEMADCLFIFGTGRYTNDVVRKICNILDTWLVHSVIITGWIPRYENSKQKMLTSESSQIRDLIVSKYPDIAFVLDEASHNTLENVVFGLDQAKKNNVNLERAIFLCKTYSTGRWYATLRKYLPNTKLLQQTYAPDNFTADNWYITEQGRNIVWWEMLRLQQYGKRWDIDTSEVEDQLEILFGSIWQ